MDPINFGKNITIRPRWVQEQYWNRHYQVFKHFTRNANPPAPLSTQNCNKNVSFLDLFHHNIVWNRTNKLDCPPRTCSISAEAGGLGPINLSLQSTFNLEIALARSS